MSGRSLMDLDAPAPVGDLLEGLTDFLDEIAARGPGGEAMVERMRVVLPVELYVRPDPEGARGVAALQSWTAPRTLTSFMPVLHSLSLVVEVDRAEQREPSVVP